MALNRAIDGVVLNGTIDGVALNRTIERIILGRTIDCTLILLNWWLLRLSRENS